MTSFILFIALATIYCMLALNTKEKRNERARRRRLKAWEGQSKLADEGYKRWQ